MSIPKPQYLPVWGAILVLALLVVAFNVIPSGLAMKWNSKLKDALGSTPAAPAPIAFAIVWPILYTLLAGAVFFLIFYPAKGTSKAVQWTALGLLVSQLALNFAWTPVFAQGKRATATLLIIIMLMLTISSLALSATAQPVAAALTGPYAAWLVFALLLSAQSQVKQTPAARQM
jgi:tryptophan-rich sensory protein